MAEPDELDEGLAADLLTMVEALQRRRALLGDDPLHDSVFKHIDEAIRQLEQAAGELMARR
jgi:hypothetical protein